MVAIYDTYNYPEYWKNRTYENLAEKNVIFHISLIPYAKPYGD